MSRVAHVSSSPQSRALPRAAPGPRFRTPFGFLATFRRDPLRFLMDSTRQYGDVVRFQFPPWSSYLFTHPRDVKHILQDNHRNYWKGVVLGKLQRIAGQGLVFSDGHLWRRQRRLVQPAFHRERIAAMATMMTDTTAEMLDRWKMQATTAQPLDVAAEMSKLTLDIVSKALFGIDFGREQERFSHAITAGMEYANHLINHLFTPPLVVPTAANRKARRALATRDQIVAMMIDRRRREGTDRGDLLSMLLSARDAETNETMNDRQLRDEVVTFLVAGHETTAVALAWAWHLLASYPSAQRRLHAEVAEVLGDRTPVLSDLADLPYTRMVLDEALRLYPPAWVTSRESYEEDEIGGERIPAGVTITLSPYVTHRHPAFWDDPEGFDPEHFTPERSAARPEYAYYPFGGGPRACIGRQFALMEGQLVLAMVARRFRLQSVPGHRVEPNPIFTLRPRYGVLMTLHPLV